MPGRTGSVSRGDLVGSAVVASRSDGVDMFRDGRIWLKRPGRHQRPGVGAAPPYRGGRWLRPVPALLAKKAGHNTLSR